MCVALEGECTTTHFKFLHCSGHFHPSQGELPSNVRQYASSAIKKLRTKRLTCSITNLMSRFSMLPLSEFMTTAPSGHRFAFFNQARVGISSTISSLESGSSQEHRTIFPTTMKKGGAFEAETAMIVVMCFLIFEVWHAAYPPWCVYYNDRRGRGGY